VVKLAAFDWTRYGTLAGTVREVAEKPVGGTAPAAASSGATAPPSYFPVMVTLEKNYVGEDTKDRLVRRGMTATVDFPLGRRTLLADLADRCIRIIRERLREP
jgi:multidrug efflux pump subunit AcrA (membrane-fusion protein)